MARLFSLNAELSRHLNRIIPFLQRSRPDVVCLQELAQSDIERIQRESGLDFCHFVQMAIEPAGDRAFGLGILARTPFLGTDVIKYAGLADGSARFDRSSLESKMATCRYAVASVCVSVGGNEFQVATTHFPWTPKGESSPFQTTAAHALIAGLQHREMVLTGDFNAPRGGTIFDLLARTWRDCIPQDVTTSIDPVLHRAGALTLMVDGLFTTPHYHATEVQLHTGLSDHQAITASISRGQTQ